MNVTSNSSQETQDGKTISHKRKADDYFINVDNPKSSRRSECLMLDMYTQTEANNPDISLKQIYDMVKSNSECFYRVEDMVTKLCNMIGAFADGASLSAQVVTTSCQEKKSQEASPAVDTQSQISQYQGSSNNSLTPSDYVTQVPQQSMMGSWEGSQLRSDDLTAINTSITDTESELSDVRTTPLKTPPKVNWTCHNVPHTTTARGQSPSSGCWLGDPNDANCRAWFSGDPKIISKCESYGLNPVKLALALTEALFTREEMAASNVRGTRGKDTLDPSKIKAIRAHVDYKFPLEEDRMEIRWQLIKPKLDSKCRSQRRLQREHKWKMEKLATVKAEPAVSSSPRPKRLIIADQEREMLLYGVSKTVVSVYTENNADETPFTPEQETGYLHVNPNE